MLLYNSRILKNTSPKYLFLDTNIFIDLTKNEELLELVQQLKGNAYALVTILSVIFEFTRGTQNVEGYNILWEFLNSLASVYPIEKHQDEISSLIPIVQKIKGDIHYTDFLLIACLFKFKTALLLSANHKDCPLQILDRIEVITTDDGKDLKNYGLYQFSQQKFEKAAEKILR